MKKIKGCILWAVAVLLLTGCSMNTVDKMYCIPKRSEEFAELQAQIDHAMTGLEYSAPRSGENQQTVQMADLDGDGEDEYLVFAKSFAEKPMRILIFDQVGDSFSLVYNIESNGSDFDKIEYVQMDLTPGLELVVGLQVSNQVPRSVSIYSFTAKGAERLLKTDYSKMLTVDLDMDNFKELFILRPGQTETDNGIAELYGIVDGVMERTNEVSISVPADKLKRVLIGQLYDGETAVFMASSMGDNALITDVFSCRDDVLVNVSLSNESGTSVQTMRNYYVYSEDIDNDGIVELPDLIPMQTLDSTQNTERRELIRWYAMKADGSEVDKMYTYHDFLGGWYLKLDEDWAPRLTVQQTGNEYIFYIWTEAFDRADKIVTIYALPNTSREASQRSIHSFVILKTDSVTYTARLEYGASQYDITQESMIRDFHRIHQVWKTGEM